MRETLDVAVHLRPEAAEETFDDGLPPMRISFATDEPVYPMRLSAAAEHSQPLRLYVLADHKMDVTDPTPDDSEPDLTFAGWLTPDGLDEHPELAKLVPERRFLTRYDTRVDPEKVTDDIHLTQAAKDEAYRAVLVQTRYVRGPSTAEVTLAVLSGVVLAGLAAGAVILVRRRLTVPEGRRYTTPELGVVAPFHHDQDQRDDQADDDARDNAPA